MAKILVADDSILTRTMLKNILLENGHQVIEAVDGNDAIAKYLEVKPDLVLMDLVMPEKDGLTAIKDIIDKDSSAKIIVCSADVQDFRVSEAIEAGASDYITKPFDKDKITNIADNCLQTSALQEVRGDVLTERAIMKDFVKNGIVRAIQALSKMAGKTVKVSISDFRLIQATEIPEYVGTKFIGVNYNLSGSNTGCAALLIPEQSATEIVSIMMGEDVSGHDDVVHSVFNEMGNVFINSFLSTFSDLLDIKVTFGAPENVNQDNLVEKMAAVQFASPVSQAYMVKGKYYLDDMEFNMFLIIHTDIKSVEYKYDLKQGKNYLVVESVDEKSFDIFRYMLKRGHSGLCITRRHPDDVRKLVGNDNLPMIWVTMDEIKISNCVCTTSLPKIAKVINSYCDKVKNVLLFIDNIEYLADSNSIGILNGFLDEIKMKNIQAKNIIIVPCSPELFEQEFVSLKDFEIIQ